MPLVLSSLFFFNDTATTEIYTLSLHDALPILPMDKVRAALPKLAKSLSPQGGRAPAEAILTTDAKPKEAARPDRKSTRLNSSHVRISYALFFLKKKKQKSQGAPPLRSVSLRRL